MSNQSSPHDSNPRNADPLTGELGAHPVGTGIGAALGGAAAGVAAGSVGGPLGAAAGAIAGGIIGALAGKGAAEVIDPTVEHVYWRTAYPSRPYFRAEYTYDDFAPAYETGWEMEYVDGDGTSWDERENEARLRWREHLREGRTPAGMTWEEARLAARDAFERAREQRERNLYPHKPR